MSTGNLITITEMARRTGLSESAIRCRIKSGKYVLGQHFYKNGRRIMMDIEACDRLHKSWR